MYLALRRTTLQAESSPEEPILISVVGGGDSHWGIILGTEDDSTDQGKSESERREELDAEIMQCCEKAEEMARIGEAVDLGCRWRSTWPISGRIPASSSHPQSKPAEEQKRKMGCKIADARTKLQELLQFKENLKNDYFEAATLLALIRCAPDEILARILLFAIPVPFDWNKTACCNSGL
ncbi:hypothetical protein M422DRAFT_276488 [Sphaerobolus stellatus SS14]|uniref:Uncharacterized protein n=1 Tax=Sphaerobolus stellatus (strain SS14) TaxID=990650 RepID=A0A0C9UC50_SPHS4|nr:hypothetical protein M422DRAFT_276488 [Sphaerobolus stellatus SS14]